MDSASCRSLFTIVAIHLHFVCTLVRGSGCSFYRNGLTSSLHTSKKIPEEKLRVPDMHLGKSPNPTGMSGIRAVEN